MKKKNLLLAGLLSLGACYAETGYVAYDDPPPPRQEVVIDQPGQIYIHGHWDHAGGSWRWRNGYYERDRPGYTYVEGRWDHRGNRRVYVQGQWRARGNVTFRDHR